MSSDSDQLSLVFPRSNRGVNYKPPRLRTTTGGRNRTPHTRWEYWCGWCRKDHFYNRRLSRETVTAMHTDHIKHICKPKALDREALGVV